jgi:hypothetical protein
MWKKFNSWRIISYRLQDLRIKFEFLIEKRLIVTLDK